MSAGPEPTGTLGSPAQGALPAGADGDLGGAAVISAAGRLVHPLVSARATGPRDTLHEACASQGLLESLGAAIGDWLLASPLGSAGGERRAAWAGRLVQEGGDAVVCPLPAQAGSPAQALFLPCGALEQLGAAPGRSLLRVSRLPDSAIGEAARVVLARVHSPGTQRRCHAALRSFFHVPRLLAPGEVFSVPFVGLPEQLREVEDDRAARPEASDSSSSDDDGDGAWADGLRPGASSPSCERRRLDPLGGLIFCDMCSFRVQSIEPVRSRGASGWGGGFRVDRRSTEVLIQGSCQARGIPYLASHLFCAAPPPLPAALQGPYKRLLGTLAPAVRAWARGGGPAAPPAVLVAGPRGCGKRLLWRSVCERLGLHLLEANCHDLAAQGPGALEEALQRLLLRAAEMAPAVLCLRRLQALALAAPQQSPAALLLLRRRLEGVLAGREGSGAGRPALLAGSCEDADEVGAPLRRAFQLELALPRPDEASRAAATAQLSPALRRSRGGVRRGALETPAGSVAKLTAGLSLSDLRSVCSEVVMCKHVHSKGEEAAPTEAERIERAVKRIQGGTKVAVTLSSKVRWADVGGLQDAKDEVMNCITLPLAQGQMFDGQKVRSGVLLFGPPGTGKTLLAKAVATECRVHFLSVKGPELLSMYIGESERNVRNLFQSARDLQPCVLFFDELDSLAPARGRGSDSGGVMDRVVSQLVTELDAMPATVFLVGATNRPDLLDRSLLRPGRLDRMVYLGIAKEKLPLLQAITRKFDLEEAPGDSGGAAGSQQLLEDIAKQCPSNLTGADAAVLCTDAYALAQKEHIALLQDIAAKLGASVSTLLLFLEALERSPAEAGEGGAPGGPAFAPAFAERGLDPRSALRVRVARRHFEEAVCRLQPSVPLEDLQRYEQLAAEYQNTKQ